MQNVHLKNIYEIKIWMGYSDTYETLDLVRLNKNDYENKKNELDKQVVNEEIEAYSIKHIKVLGE